MPSNNQDLAQDEPVVGKANMIFVQKVEALQERVWKMGIVTDGLDDITFMDKALGEDSGDVRS